MDLGKWLALQWDRIAAWVSVIVGAVCLLAGWLGVSDTAYLSEQVPYLVSGAIGGLFFLGLGAMLWLSADLRDEWYKLDRIEKALSPGRVPEPSTAVGQTAADTVEMRLPVVDGRELSHAVTAHSHAVGLPRLEMDA